MVNEGEKPSIRSRLRANVAVSLQPFGVPHAGLRVISTRLVSLLNPYSPL